MRVLLIVLVLIPYYVIAAENLRTEVWLKKPIPLTLKSGSNTVVYLPNGGDYSVGVPKEMQGTLYAYPVENVVYFTTSNEFKTTFVPIKNVDTEQQIILEIKSLHVTDQYDLRIIDGTKPIEGSLDIKAAKIDVRKALVQHASQSLYAPARLIPNNSYIKSSPVISKQIRARTLVDNNPGNSICIDVGRLIAKPIQAWNSGKHYVTAVRVMNTSNEVITVDPRGCHLAGNFSAMSFQHGNLEPKYSDPCQDSRKREQCNTKRTYKDVTTLYYLSERPFWEVVSHEQILY